MGKDQKHETFEFVIKSPCRHSVLDLSLPRTRYGGIKCFQAVTDSAPIFIGVTRRNDVRGRFSKVSILNSASGEIAVEEAYGLLPEEQIKGRYRMLVLTERIMGLKVAKFGIDPKNKFPETFLPLILQS